MKIRSIVDTTYKQVLVPTLLHSPLLGEDVFFIALLIDTGATHTTILQGNALKLGINFSTLRLSHEPVLGVSGHQPVYELDDVTLAFQINSSPSDLVYTKLEKIHVVKPNKKTIPSTRSVMGMDILHKLHFDFCYPRVNLTCDIRKVKGVSFIK